MIGVVIYQTDHTHTHRGGNDTLGMFYESIRSVCRQLACKLRQLNKPNQKKKKVYVVLRCGRPRLENQKCVRPIRSSELTLYNPVPPGFHVIAAKTAI